MSSVPEKLSYTKDHEWAEIQDNIATIGITDHAQSELGDIVFVELPKVGASLNASQSFGTIEAVKTVAELYSPVSGKVVEVNTSLADDAGIINKDPYAAGWIVKIEMAKSDQKLMDASEYKALIGE